MRINYFNYLMKITDVKNDEERLFTISYYVSKTFYREFGIFKRNLYF